MATTVAACPDGPITIVNRISNQPHTASAPAPAMPRPLEKFYKGEPLALGITQILVGAVQFAVGVAVNMADPFWLLSFNMYLPVWSGMLYIISGSLSVAAAKKPKIPLVKGSLGMNIISSVMAGSALVIYLITLMETRHQHFCNWHPEECIIYSVVIYQNLVPPDDPTTASNTHTDAVAYASPPYKDLATS
ncbi:membrane-spanning 4-domains subfamily A member 4A-like isoform X2 [Emydura macquarii macquarii]|uniref:membrane-spanning 4-domains subfamily A member 4A-like isoform X2 n=1 Tax=Emydura macquarii macquarii TaxID=1129001 RepID=UPI00352B6447